MLNMGVAEAAPNPVVVIPLAGDDISQQSISANQNTASDSDGCVTGFVSTHKSKATMVTATSVASVYLTALEGAWYVRPQFSKNFGSWSNFPSNINTPWAGGAADTYSLSTNTATMELDPDSTYRFRVEYLNVQAHTMSRCQLTLKFNFITEDVVTPVVFVPL